MKIGYIRVSSAEQNTARQEVLMEELGVDEVYIDRTSGNKILRESPYSRAGSGSMLTDFYEGLLKAGEKD